ncbi:MAG: hypothetical protein AAFQ02_03490 [Bacteroidota bacterium]
MKIFEWLAEMRYRNALLYQIGMIHAIVAVILLIGIIVDPREVMGINPWIKPTKFFLSTTALVFTMGWFMFDLRLTRPRWIKVISWTYVIGLLIENIIITLQASRGVRSHFNYSTAMDGALFGAMGLFIGIITLATTVLFVLFLIHRGGNPIHNFAVRISLLLHLVGSWIGGVMISRGGHAVGIVDGGEGIPFLNWSTLGGDLRIGHFLGLHAIQAIPLFSYWIRTKFSFAPTTQFILTALFSAIYAGLISWCYMNAMNGVPLLAS